MDAAQSEHAYTERAQPRRLSAPEAPASARPHERLASGVGNRGFGRMIARMRDGEGILPSGLVHPEVESAIAVARGGGAPLDRTVSDRVAPAVGDSLADVRVHTGDGAAALARAVSARAFTVGNDIFFAPGEYRPGTPAGDQLIAHEATHVAQQRGAPESGPLTVSQPGDAMEREAEALSSDVGY